MPTPKPGRTTRRAALPWTRPPAEPARPGLGLVIAWSAAAPDRVGEVLLASLRGAVLGRGDGDGDELPRMRPVRQRPGVSEPREPLSEPAVSRRQLDITLENNGLLVESVGICPLLVNGHRTARALIGAGDVLHLEDQLVLLCVERPFVLPPLRHWGLAPSAFGVPDACGIVGESPAMWRLRDLLAFVAQSAPHVLVLGDSGAGKELMARAIHALSPRAGRSMVARNAATIPASLMDAELFGNVRDYPNPGMRERVGIIGEADGSTLFLDEIGELPGELQAHLLRVLDAHGEYHRLGETRARTSDLRLVAATNRAPESLKHDLLARLPLRLVVPPLDDRREDLPLLVRHLLLRAASQSPTLGPTFFEGWDGTRGQPRVDPRLVERLLRHRYTAQVRELEAILWRAMTSSTGGVIGLTSEVEELLRVPDAPPRAPDEGAEPDPIAVAEALAAHDGNVTRAARSLGLPSRFALYRLMKKHDVS